MKDVTLGIIYLQGSVWMPFIYMIFYYAVKSSFVINEKMVGINLFFGIFLHDLT